ncbi:Senescence-associated protein DH [Citrus sinensis]|nr:tetraspanin-8 [Citrus x clementina]XP_006485846.2 tetraspanin-8-like [Citrus sinensis]KAH9722448.1 Senescence-associated protein DH [Citrus sinensis]
MGSCCKSNFLLSLYLFAVFLLAVWFVAFASFVVIVTNDGAAEAVSKLGFKEYRLGDYKNWLQRNFVSDKKWKEIRSCMIDAHQVCKNLDRNNVVDQTAEDFYKRNDLSPVQSGCCIPPVACGFQYQNTTFWIPRISASTAKDNDCSAWSNHQQTLCYNCDSCKAGVITNVKKQWRVLATINFCLAVFIAIFCSAGCCDIRNKNRRDHNKSLNQCLV